MRPDTFAAIYAFEPVLFPVEVDSRQVLHATNGIPRHATCHEKSPIDAIQPCRACYHTDHAASVTTSSTRDSQARLLHAHCWTLWCLVFTTTTFETEVSFRSTYSLTRRHKNQLCPQAAVDSAFCRTGKHSSEGYEALAALARRRRSRFKSKQEAAKRFRSRPPFSAFHKDCFEDYMAHGLSEQAGMQQPALLYICDT